MVSSNVRNNDVRNDDRNCFRIVSRTAATGSQEATAHLMAGVLIVAYAGVDGFVCNKRGGSGGFRPVDESGLETSQTLSRATMEGDEWTRVRG